MAESNGDGGRKKSAFREQVAAERTRSENVHQAGGGSGFGDFFSNENRLRPMTRGEVLGLLEMVEYSRRSHVWWRVLGRFLTRTPGMWNLPKKMAKAYWNNTLKPAIEKTEAALEKQQAQENREAVK